MTRAAAAAIALAFAAPAAAVLPVARAEIVRTYPHDPDAFTEGLFLRDGMLYESTGPYDRHGRAARSTIRQVRLDDGRVIKSITIPPDLFGEGIVDYGKQLVSVTWQGGQGFRWSLPDLRRTGGFRYPGEGWGMTRMGARLVLSDGTSDLRLLDPVTLAERGRIKVTAEGRPVTSLNELEYAHDEILANIWQTDLIARIDPASGRVKGWIDLSGLPRPAVGGPNLDVVANGIAYDAARDRLFVTGKNWPSLYEIRFNR